MSLLLSELRKVLEKAGQAVVPPTSGSPSVRSYVPSTTSPRQSWSVNTLAEIVVRRLENIYENPSREAVEELISWLENIDMRNHYLYSLLVKEVSQMVSGKPYASLWHTIVETRDPSRVLSMVRGGRRDKALEVLRKYLSPSEIRMVVDKNGVDPERLAMVIRERIESMMRMGRGMVNEKDLVGELEKIRGLLKAGVSLSSNPREAWERIVETIGGRDPEAGRIRMIVQRVALGDLKTASKMLSMMSHGHGSPVAVSVVEAKKRLRGEVSKAGEGTSKAKTENTGSVATHMVSRLEHMASSIESKTKPVQMKPR